MLSPDSPAASAGPIHVAIAAIEERLKAAFPVNRFQHELLPAPMNIRLMNELASRRTPFVGLAFLGFKRAPASARMLGVRLRFGVYLVVSNPTSRARLIGDRLGPGLAQMVHAAVIALHGWTLAGERDAGAGSIEAGDLDNTDGTEWAKDGNACGALTLEVPATFTASGADELLRIAATWTFDGPTDAATDLYERAP